MAKKLDSAAMMKEAKKLMAEITEMPAADLKDEARFSEDLGVDSMKALEIVAAIEKKFKVSIPEEKIPTIRTPKDVYEIVKKLLKL
jgi:acyl carrier protein